MRKVVEKGQGRKKERGEGEGGGEQNERKIEGKREKLISV